MEQDGQGREVGRYAALLVLFTAVQFAAEYAGLSWAGVHAGVAAPVWLGTAISVSVVFFGGYRYLPAIGVGALLASLAVHGSTPLITHLGSGAASLCEAGAAVALMRRFDFRTTLDYLRDVVVLALGVACVSTAISATLGVGSLLLADLIDAQEFWRVWLTWWFADATSAVVLAPVILFAVGWQRARTPLAAVRTPVFPLSFGALAIVSAVVFLAPNTPKLFVLPFVVFPFALFVALRCGPVGAITSNFMLTVIALIGTYRSTGPFSSPEVFTGVSLGDELLATQVFAVTVAITGLALAASIAEGERARDELSDAERRFRSLVEHVPAGIYLDDIDDSGTGRITTLYVSPQIEEMFNVRAAEFYEDSGLWTSLRHPDDREKAVAANLAHYRTGEPLSLESRMVARGGSELWVREEAVLLADIAGHDRVSQGVVVDITELIRSQRQRERQREQMINAQEEERRRIASDIHDDSVQGMTAVGLRLETLRRKVAAGESDDGAFDVLEREVQAAVARLRHLMFELRPPELDEQGLASAIEGYISLGARDAGFQFELKNSLETEPDATVRAGLYRIAQEALRNVMKHAEAGRVAVMVGSAHGGVTLRIEDDGKGLREEAASPIEHFGLAGIRERAAMMGGWARIEGSPGAGTTVHVWVPS